MLSMSAVRLRDAWLADAAETGLKWTVLSHELFNIPRVADLVQAGTNCTNHTTLAETELQLCRKILEKVVQKNQGGARELDNGLTSRRRCYGQSLQGQWRAPSCSRLSASLGAEPWLSSSMVFFGTCAQ